MLSQGIADYGIMMQEGPTYVVSSTVNADAPELTFVANGYGKNPYSNTKVHVPKYAVNQCFAKTKVGNADCHIGVVDYKNGIVVEGWQCDNNSSGSGILACTWGRWYPIGSAGIASSGPHPGYGGNHAAIAFSQFDIRAEELQAGYIPHMLSIAVHCANGNGIYPADTGKTDEQCTSDNPGNFPTYGGVIDLKVTYNIATSPYGPLCKTVLEALQERGAVVSDTGTDGLLIYTASNAPNLADPAKPVDPWIAVTKQLVAEGDATGSYSATDHGSVPWRSCLQHLSANDLEYRTLKP